MSIKITNETINNLVRTLCDVKLNVLHGSYCNNTADIAVFSSAQEARQARREAFQNEVENSREEGSKIPRSWRDIAWSCNYLGERFVIDADDIDFNITCEEGREYRVETSDGDVYLFKNADEFRTLLENERDYRRENENFWQAREEEENRRWRALQERRRRRTMMMMLMMMLLMMMISRVFYIPR
jgi:hypothetical protein